jgi:hypothetical protein
MAETFDQVGTGSIIEENRGKVNRVVENFKVVATGDNEVELIEVNAWRTRECGVATNPPG